MRFSLTYPLLHHPADPELFTGAAVTEVARAAEDAGFDALAFTEHPMPSDRWLAAGGHDALDPFIALTWAAAATERLRLLTNITVVAYRNPFLLAKTVATLDSLSGGRVILGAAAGYLKSEFRALGVDFDERNELTDEGIVAMKLAWTQENVTFEGRHFRARGNTMQPRPASTPHPPIWVGGNSKRAIRRAVDLGQGWVPFPNPDAQTRALKTPALTTIEDLAERIDYARDYAAEAGRTEPLDICCSPLRFVRLGETRQYGPDLFEEIDALAAVGVTWVTVGFGAATRAEWLAQVESFGEEVLSRF